MEKNYLEKLVIVILVLFIIFLTFQIFPYITALFSFFYALIMPFSVGFILSFILHGLIEKLEKLKIKRIIAVSIVFVLLIGLLLFSFIKIIPLTINEINSFILNLDDYVEKIMSVFNTLCNKMRINSDFIPTKESIILYIEQLLEKFNKSLFSFLENIYHSLDLIILTPIITFYFLYDYPKITKSIINYLNKKEMENTKNLLFDMDKILGSYFKGVLVIMFILFVTSSFLFYIVGLDYAILFGILIAVTNIIPIIGQYVGGIFVALFALTQSFSLMIQVSIIIIVLQLLESNVLTPYIQSKTSSTHPLLILFSFVIFGKLFGILGMIFSIPLMGTFILIYKYLKDYLKKRKKVV